ncbi:MAG: glycosyltransferase family 39 protein [Planctomycetaceae bacterium]|jgi:hypothetical protein|nr:glycosyltransferase family 39 protein [Planctomycetaceae bacterium]
MNTILKTENLYAAGILKGFLVFFLFFFLFLFTSSLLPLTWDEGEVSRRSDEFPVKWSGTINNEGHPQLPIILAATGKFLLPEKFFSKKFRLRSISIFFVSISFTVLLYRLRQEFNRTVACFAVMSVLLIPRLFAVLQMATWDSCFIASWICCLAAFQIPFKNVGRAVIFGFCLGLAFSAKFTGFAIPIPFAIWAIIVLSLDKSLRKFVHLKHLIIVTIISTATFILFNPPFWSNPFTGVHRFFLLNIYREINIPIMFIGQLYDLHHPLPFYNTIFWTIITIPAGLFLFFIVGCCSILFGAIKCNEISESGLSRWRFGLLLFLNMIILLLVRALPGMPVHDGVRLFVGAYIFLGIIAGIGAAEIWQTKKIAGIFVTKKFFRQICTLIIFAVSLFNMFWYAPQWLSFYNFMVGGLSGATRIGMEPTYYWDGFDREVIDWLNANTGKDELILFSKFSPDTFSIYRSDGILLPDFYAASESGNKDKIKAKRIRYYVTQNRSGLQTNVDEYFKKHTKPVYIKTIRKGGIGAWNLGTVPIIEIYDIKNL